MMTSLRQSLANNRCYYHEDFVQTDRQTDRLTDRQTDLTDHVSDATPQDGFHATNPWLHYFSRL